MQVVVQLVFHIVQLVQDQPIQIASLALCHITIRLLQNNAILFAHQINSNPTFQLLSV